MAGRRTASTHPRGALDFLDLRLQGAAELARQERLMGGGMAFLHVR
jgi:hypothetical protein